VTGALLDRPTPMAERPVPGGRVTLEERLNSILHEARTNGSSECPLCHARMAATPAEAACGSCGSQLC
jgi:hypothetical protein